MNYPEHIYNTYEIVEKDICGEKHYGLVRVYNIFGWKFRRHVRVYDGCHTAWISSTGVRWLPSKHQIQAAIEDDNSNKEYKFRRKVTK